MQPKDGGVECDVYDKLLMLCDIAGRRNVRFW